MQRKQKFALSVAKIAQKFCEWKPFAQFYNFPFKFLVNDLIMFSHLQEGNGVNSFKKTVEYSLRLNLQREINKISLNKNRGEKNF